MPDPSPVLRPLQDGHIRVGKLNLVDLAGSERQSKTGATGAQAGEARANIACSSVAGPGGKGQGCP